MCECLKGVIVLTPSLLLGMNKDIVHVCAMFFALGV